MSVKRLVEVSACVWMDLLGYGGMLRKVGFDLTQGGAQEAIQRLFLFQDTVTRHSAKLFSTVVLNDGCVAFRTLSPRSKAVTHDFLNRAYRLHLEANALDQEQGFPGVRSVVAVGFRHRRASDNFARLIDGYGAYLLSKLERSEMSAREAIIRALVTKPPFDLVPDLQANFAFTKAYLADRAGAKGGFGGPHFFIDQNILPSPLPMWIKVHATPTLVEEGIGGPFVQVAEMKVFALTEENKELLDAFEIAERITGSTDIAHKLRQLTIREDRRKRRSIDKAASTTQATNDDP